MERWAGIGDRASVNDLMSGDPADWVSQSDDALVRACLAGNGHAWEELVDRYGRLVYAIPRRMGLSERDAEDVFQNVFLSLLRHLGTLRDRTRLASWLITTARRESWRRSSAIGRRAEAELGEEIVAGEPAALDEVLRWEREQIVHLALRRIDQRCAQLLTALFLEPASPRYDVIAARLGIPVGSIGPTRARCFRKLEAALRELGFDGG